MSKTKAKPDKKVGKKSKAKKKAKKLKAAAELKRNEQAAAARRRFKEQMEGAAAASRKRKRVPNATHHQAHSADVKKWHEVEAPPAPLLDARGHRLPLMSRPGAGRGRVPASKGRTYTPQALSTMDVVSLMNACPDTPMGHRLRAWIAFGYRTGARISETLDIYEDDLNPRKGSVRIRNGKGSKPRMVSMDRWGWDECKPWLEVDRKRYPAGPVFCVLEGPTAGWRPMGNSQLRHELHRLAKDAGLRARVHPHAFRHTFAVEWVREGRPLHLLQKQLGHADLRVTTRYLVSICHEELLAAAFQREAPGVPVPDLMEALARG